MTRQVSLSINETPISLSYFVEEFIDHTIAGMLATLEGTGEIESLVITVEGDEVTVNLNNAIVPTNFFVNKVFRNTIVGMVSSLKGVSEIKRLTLTIRK